MEYLKSFSLIWSMSFILVAFLMLYDLRFDRKKNIIISCAVMVPLILLTAGLVFVFGVDMMSRLILVTLSIPSFLFFLLMAKKRDGKFFFTFCFLDTVGFELITLTMLLEQWVGNGDGTVLVVSRLILFPLLTWIAYAFFRKGYMELQDNIHRGWGLCALVSALFYLMLAYMVSFPTIITERPEDVTGVLLLFVLMPVTYFSMFRVLSEQMRAYWAEERRRNVERQAELLQNELEIGKDFISRAKQYRHDVRHILQVTLEHLKQGHIDGAKEYLADYSKMISESTLTTFCENPTLNAILRLNDRRCEQEGISFQAVAALPAELPYTQVEMGLLFGNLLENAWEAAGKCEKPFVRFSSQYKDGNLYVQIENSVAASVEFADGMPVSTKDGGGIGVRSAVEILNKYMGMMEMKQEGNTFTTQIIQPLSEQLKTVF